MSVTSGTPGRIGDGLLSRTRKHLELPGSRYGFSSTGEPATITMWPASRSVKAGATPRYGTCTMSRPAAFSTMTAATWVVLPAPAEPKVELALVGLHMGDEVGERVAGERRVTVIANGAEATAEIGLKSLFSSNETFCAYFAVVSWKIGVDISV